MHHFSSVALILAATLISPSAHAQDAATSALGAPVQTKTGAPPATPTVKPGEGATALTVPAPRPDPRFTASPEALAALAPFNRVDQHVMGRGLKSPDHTMWGLAPSGATRMSAVLSLPDGRTIHLENRGKSAPTSTDPFPLSVGVLQHAATVPAGVAAFEILTDGDNLKLVATFEPSPGEFIDAPAALVSSRTGTVSVGVAGGGTLTVSFEGYHPLTSEEQAFTDSFPKGLN